MRYDDQQARWKLPRCAAIWSMKMLFAAAGSAHAAESTMPAGRHEEAPLSANNPIKSGTLYLELVVNELPTGHVIPVRYREGVYEAYSRDLAAVSVRTGSAPDELVDLSRLGSVQMEYDSIGQRLKLTVPPDWLPQQSVGQGRLYDRTPAAVSFGMLFNYDVYAAAPTLGPSSASAWVEQRLFDRWGTVVNNGVYRRDAGAAGGSTSHRYLRYDTFWRYSDQDRMLSYTAGDLITGALSWSSAVRLGGVSVERDFTVRPDIVTYPLPQFSGQAAVPTAVDLFINGSKTTSGQVNPGPFTLNDVPFINGAGEASVVTTDALGRQVATTVQFYVANTLLQKGLSDYSLAVGAVRRGYGMQAFSYGKFAASGTARYGLTDYLTVDGHAEGGERFALGGLGFDLGVGLFGVFNVAASQSRLGGSSGQQYALGYSYSSQHFSVALQRVLRTAGYGDLSVYDLPSNVTYGLVRQSTQATGALNLGAIGGTLGAGYFDVRGAHGSRTRIVNLSHSRPILGWATLYASVNRTIGNQGIAAQAQLILPLGNRGTVTAGLARDENRRWSERVQYSRNVPSDGGFGWNLAYAGGGSHYQQADATWRNRYFQAQGGVYGSRAGQSYTRWAEVQGSVVMMDGRVFPANRVDDAFVLVSTQGQRDIPVRYENQLVGTTDRSGHLLVPWAPSFYAAKYEIDPLGLPGNMQVPVVERRVAVRNRSGALVTFPVEKIVSARIMLVDGTGKPLKVGARVVHEESNQTSVVGWNGETYFANLSALNHLRITTADGRECRAAFPLDRDAAEMSRVGPLVCSE
ncbi:fimbria/pilus outer membrane usher protein [Paraburkholderia megapolitana]|uniref:fimbria/pilus outer membrane usher protein n=1 Tax=Paraburkholderia TaxID=1822464 RepID=UPI0027DFB5BD|nr:fimbria/pilus outer membrane usher protein [Paraburkholderia megapolitana]